jgi:hypothetical protein
VVLRRDSSVPPMPPDSVPPSIQLGSVDGAHDWENPVFEETMSFDNLAFDGLSESPDLDGAESLVCGALGGE